MENITFDVEFVSSPFGGGWIIPHTERGYEACHAYFEDDTMAIPGGSEREGYMFEPQELDDIFDIFDREKLKTNWIKD
jgi:hypothetical protein